jgi:hypothetical protein
MEFLSCALQLIRVTRRNISNSGGTEVKISLRSASRERRRLRHTRTRDMSITITGQGAANRARIAGRDASATREASLNSLTIPEQCL